jgi:tetratricopeptide (TPR) repeat protein
MMTPEQVVAHFDRLKTALGKRDRRAIVSVGLSLLDGNAPIGKRWQTIATLLFYSGELQAALAAIENYVTSTNNSAHSQFERAALTAQAGRLDQAYRQLEKISPNTADTASYAFLRGSIAMNIGNFTAAKDYFNTALDENRLLGQAMLQLSLINDLGFESEIGKRICAAEQFMAEAQLIDQMQHMFALGRVNFERHQHLDAFNNFSEGAAIGASLRPYDAAMDHANAQASRTGYTSQSIKDISSRVTMDTSRPIFVTGLARSGTTLVEQILASHSCVVGGEELGKMQLVENDIGGSDAISLDSFCKIHGYDDAAATYLHLASERFGNTGRFVDKSLDASRVMGLIASILPQAAIIWVRRDPLDCAWSAFRTYFAAGLEWSWRLEDIARHFKLEDMLFDHWKSLLGDRILEVQYEDLVVQPDYEIGRLLKHCNLAEEPGPFVPHQTQRSVVTASATQVRKPINRAAIGLSGEYADFLKPFIDAYY